MLGGGSGATLEALPMPLGSLTELLPPPTLPGPVGMPLVAAVPAPAEPAAGEPAALPDPLAPWANELIGAINVVMTARTMVVEAFDIGCSPYDAADNECAG